MRQWPWLILVTSCVVGALLLPIVHRIWTRPLPTTLDLLRAELPADSLDALRHPTSFRTHQRVADVLMRLGHAGEAEGPARRAVALAPRQASAHATLGAVLAAEARFAPAIDELTLAMRGGAHDRMTYLGLGWAYDNQRRDSAAGRTYREALDRGYTDPVMMNAYAAYLIRASQPHAMDYAERVVAIAPGWAPGHATLSKAYASRNDAHHAREHMQRAAELYPSYMGYWADLGDYAFLDGDTAAAWTAFSHARALDSVRFDAMSVLHAMWMTADAAHH